VNNVSAQCASMMMGTVCFGQKLLFGHAKFGDLGADGDRDKNLSSKVP